ncbi:MAG TPA: HAD family phosphatase [Phnomibacter sp.]|nr:HAD family phosphatase [Phnomibacter sp.]
MMLQAVIFDMDGTIVNSMPYHLKSWDLFFEHHGINMPPERFEQIHHGTLYDIMPRIFGEHITAKEAYELGMLKEKLFRDLYRGNVTPLPGLPALLKALKAAHVKIGLATAADFTNADFTIDELGLRPYFDTIVTSDLVPEGKPSPAVYQYAAHELQVPPKACLVFEDTPSGIMAAHRAGMQVIGVASGLSHQALRQLPVADVVDHFEQLTVAGLNQYLENAIYG